MLQHKPSLPLSCLVSLVVMNSSFNSLLSLLILPCISFVIFRGLNRNGQLGSCGHLTFVGASYDNVEILRLKWMLGPFYEFGVLIGIAEFKHSFLFLFFRMS